MIDEKKLIDELNAWSNLDKEMNELVLLGIDTFKRMIDKQPKVGEWIPVEERLPEKSLNSVIDWDTYRERCVFVQYYMNEWILGSHESVNIVAWRPVPEPYKDQNGNDPLIITAVHFLLPHCGYYFENDGSIGLSCCYLQRSFDNQNL